MKERKTEHPILFSATMVRAILDGHKTQARWVLGPRSILYPGPRDVTPAVVGDGVWGWVSDGVILAGIGACPYGQPGDRLWVRETWQAIHVSIDPETGYGDEVTFAAKIPENDRAGYWSAVYAATDAQASDHRDDRGFPWRPSIHMPRWASRLTLAVTEIRVERLQAISEEDARAEGIIDGGCLTCGESEPCGCDNPRPDARDAFCARWDSINRKRPGCSWADDPLVWVVSFDPEVSR